MWKQESMGWSSAKRRLLSWGLNSLLKKTNSEAQKDEVQNVLSPPQALLQLFNNLALLILMEFDWTWGNATPKLNS